MPFYIHRKICKENKIFIIPLKLARVLVQKIAKHLPINTNKRNMRQNQLDYM